MNQRILELAREVWPDPNISHVNHIKFAELIVKECILISRTSTDGFGAGKRMEEHFGIEE